MLESLKEKFEALFFTRAEQRAFLEDVSVLVEDGVPLTQAVQAVHDTHTGTIQQVAATILQGIAEGKSFADGLQRWFPYPIVEIIRAGEEGGTLVTTLRSAAETLAQESYVLSTLLGSIVYPLAVIILGLGVAVFIRHSVFSNFSKIKPVSEWPSNARFLEHLAGFLQSWWWLVILAVLGIGVFIALVLREVTGEPRKLIDQIPVLSLYRYVHAARFMETLGLLINNGITIRQALNIMLHDASPYLGWHLHVMGDRLSGGRENVADVLDTGLVPAHDIVRLKVIARGKGFEHALIRLGKQMAKRNADRVMLTGKITGGILLGIGAGFAAFMILAIYNTGSFIGS